MKTTTNKYLHIRWWSVYLFSILWSSQFDPSIFISIPFWFISLVYFSIEKSGWIDRLIVDDNIYGVIRYYYCKSFGIVMWLSFCILLDVYTNNCIILSYTMAICSCDSWHQSICLSYLWFYPHPLWWLLLLLLLLNFVMGSLFSFT